jgi:hypothetical protein
MGKVTRAEDDCRIKLDGQVEQAKASFLYKKGQFQGNA